MARTARITAQDVEIFNLVEIDGKPQKEVGKICGVSQGAVSKIVRKMRAWWGEAVPRRSKDGEELQPEARRERLYAQSRVHRARLEHGYTEAMQAWRRSCENHVTVKKVMYKGELRDERVSRMSFGNPRYLAEARVASEKVLLLDGMKPNGEVSLKDDGRLYEQPLRTHDEQMEAIDKDLKWFMPTLTKWKEGRGEHAEDGGRKDGGRRGRGRKTEGRVRKSDCGMGSEKMQKGECGVQNEEWKKEAGVGVELRNNGISRSLEVGKMEAENGGKCEENEGLIVAELVEESGITEYGIRAEGAEVEQPVGVGAEENVIRAAVGADVATAVVVAAVASAAVAGVPAALAGAAVAGVPARRPLPLDIVRSSGKLTVDARGQARYELDGMRHPVECQWYEPPPGPPKAFWMEVRWD